MMLSRLLIHNFRNIESANISLKRGFNFLIGPNGSGKTSILEAIYTLGHGRTFRNIQAAHVIRHDQNNFILHGRLIPLEHKSRELTIALSKNFKGNSKIRIDGSDGHKIAALAKLMPIQLITPEGFTLLNGSPKHRRAFLDWGCFHNEPQFFSVWSAVKRLLKQRNAALRQVKYYNELRHWDYALIAMAHKISQWRSNYIESISNDIKNTCREFLPELSLSISFQQGWDQEADYSDILVRQFERDRMLTYTTLGPHKADLKICVEGITVADILSRGQLKLLICALKLAQGEHFTKKSGKRCLYLLDDFASELDKARRKLLAERLQATQAQIFLSAITIAPIKDMLDGNSTMFCVKHGKIHVQK
ncbi:MAG: DNA replication/repair protein RecF [Candidatus Arsenophonus melophagi]|nr:DNA replication/repair protein RecF [Candidatus Arsenophonus melophagi]